MEATITINGNQRDGYTVTTKLPTEWVSKFSVRLGAHVCYTVLDRNWNRDTEESGYRSSTIHVDTLDMARERKERTAQQITQAKEVLSTVVQTSIEQIISL